MPVSIILLVLLLACAGTIGSRETNTAVLSHQNIFCCLSVFRVSRIATRICTRSQPQQRATLPLSQLGDNQPGRVVVGPVVVVSYCGTSARLCLVAAAAVIVVGVAGAVGAAGAIVGAAAAVGAAVSAAVGLVPIHHGATGGRGRISRRYCAVGAAGAAVGLAVLLVVLAVGERVLSLCCVDLDTAAAVVSRHILCERGTQGPRPSRDHRTN